MCVRPKHYLGVLAVLTMAMPVWAGKKSSHTDSAPFDTLQAVTIGTTQLQPGHYTFEAKESGNQLEIRKDDNVIATVPCHWIQLSKKAQDSEVLSDRNRVIQVEFEGRTEAVKVG